MLWGSTVYEWYNYLPATKEESVPLGPPLGNAIFENPPNKCVSVLITIKIFSIPSHLLWKSSPVFCPPATSEKRSLKEIGVVLKYC